MTAKGKILVILSDADEIPVYKKAPSSTAGTTVDKQESGFFLTELTRPLTAILEAGYEPTFASPLGKTPHQDPNSESLLVYAGNFYGRRHDHAILEKMKKENGFDTPRKFSSITDEELDTFDGIFIPGGHAPIVDLGDNPDLGRILKHFHEKSKPTAAICHGPYAFLSTKPFAYKGYKIASWSDQEEKVMETMWGGEVPRVESALREAGAEMVTDMKEKAGGIVVDREVVSGGNPLAADSLGKKFLEMLEKK